MLAALRAWFPGAQGGRNGRGSSGVPTSSGRTSAQAAPPAGFGRGGFGVGQEWAAALELTFASLCLRRSPCLSGRSIGFDGTKLALAKTNDSQAGWEMIGGSRINGNTISAPVVGFSYATVLADPSPLNDPPHLVTEEWHFENFFTGSTNPFKTERVVFPTLDNADTELHDAEPAGQWETLASVAPPVDWFENGSGTSSPSSSWELWTARITAVFSNQLGTTFWADSVAPSGNVRQTHTKIGRLATMTLTRVLQKNDANAWLKAVVSGLALDLIDTAAAGPTDSECPWAVSAVASDPCSASMVADVGFKLDAWYTLPNGGIVPATCGFFSSASRLA